MMNKYKFYLSAENCLYEVKVNDFCILEELEGYKLVSYEPINHLIGDGAFHLSIHIRPISSKQMIDDSISYSCRITCNDGNGEYTVFEIGSLEEFSNLPEARIEEVIPVQNTNSAPLWLSGNIMKIDNELISLVLSQYVQVWELFRSKNIQKLLDLLAVREKTYADAFGLSVNERRSECMEEYTSFVNDPDYILFDLKPQFFKPKLQGFGKLFSLEDSQGFHPVFFSRKDKKGCIKIQAYFALLDGELKIVL